MNTFSYNFDTSSHIFCVLESCVTLLYQLSKWVCALSSYLVDDEVTTLAADEVLVSKLASWSFS